MIAIKNLWQNRFEKPISEVPLNSQRLPQILVRRAGEKDLSAIVPLLHSDNLLWDRAEIAKRLPDMYVLYAENVLAGTALTTAKNGMLHLEWACAHPRYSELSVAGLFYLALVGVGLKRPVGLIKSTGAWNPRA